jgi:S1-C subfamily serine protease
MRRPKTHPSTTKFCRGTSFVTLISLLIFFPSAAFAQQKSQQLYEDYAKKVIEQSQDDPLIGIWSGSLCGKRIILAVVHSEDKRANVLEAVLLNGKDVGYGFKDGDAWFFVSHVATRGVYEGKTLYRTRLFKNWYPNRVVMTGEDVFSAYDDVTTTTCGSTANTYVRREPRAKDASGKDDGSSGSGFLLWQTALIVTCNHVVEGASKITVHFASGSSYDARVLARDANNDIAVLSLVGFSPVQEGLRLSMQNQIAAGDQVHALGYPLGEALSRQPSIVSGQVSSTLGMEDSPTEFRMSTPINPGNSGGPILNDRGDVLGIAVSGIRGRTVEGISFGIKITTALPLLQQVGVRFGEMDNRPSQTASQIFSLYSKTVVMIQTK